MPRGFRTIGRVTGQRRNPRDTHHEPTRILSGLKGPFEGSLSGKDYPLRVAHSAPVVPDLFRPVRLRERRLRSTIIPPQQPGRMPSIRWQRRGVWAALSAALEARLWGRYVSPREAPLFRGRKSDLTQRFPGGLGEHQSGDDAGKGGGDEVESGRDRVARGRQEGGEDQGCRAAEDGDRDAVAQRE
jgi:hypothetical protein